MFYNFVTNQGEMCRMNDFIKELEMAKTISVIMSDESGFNVTFTGDIEDVTYSDDTINLFCENGKEINFFRFPDELLHDCEGYIFIYGQVTICLSLLA